MSVYEMFYYYINMDERGTFSCDVRNEDEKTVWEYNTDNLEDGDSTIFEDGFMKHKKDIAGLEEYLKSLKIMPSFSILKAGQE